LDLFISNILGVLLPSAVQNGPRLYFERARQQSGGRVLKAIIAGVPQKFAEGAPALMWHTEMPRIVGHIEQHADRLPHVGWDSSKQGM